MAWRVGTAPPIDGNNNIPWSFEAPPSGFSGYEHAIPSIKDGIVLKPIPVFGADLAEVDMPEPETSGLYHRRNKKRVCKKKTKGLYKSRQKKKGSHKKTCRRRK